MLISIETIHKCGALPICLCCSRVDLHVILRVRGHLFHWVGWTSSAPDLPPLGISGGSEPSITISPPSNKPVDLNLNYWQGLSLLCHKTSEICTSSLKNWMHLDAGWFMCWRRQVSFLHFFEQWGQWGIWEWRWDTCQMWSSKCQTLWVTSIYSGSRLLPIGLWTNDSTLES